MNLTKKQQTYLVVVILLLAGLGGLYWKFARPQLTKYNDVAQEVIDKRAALAIVKESYYNRSGPEEVVRELRAALTPWNEEWARSKRAYNAEEHKVPEGTKFKGYYFREELLKVQKEMVGKAYAKRIWIPESLGFTDVIPPDETVDAMLNQLYTTKFMIEVLLDCKMVELREFVVGQPIAFDAYVQLFPYKLTVLMTMENLVDFLHKTSANSRYLSVRSIGLNAEKRRTGTYINAEMVLFTTRLLDEPIMTVPSAATYYDDDDEDW